MRVDEPRDACTASASPREEKVGETLTVGDGDWQLAARHASGEDRRRLHDLDHRQPRLVMLGGVAGEPRPRVGARHQVRQRREPPRNEFRAGCEPADLDQVAEGEEAEGPS